VGFCRGLRSCFWSASNDAAWPVRIIARRHTGERGTQLPSRPTSGSSTRKWLWKSPNHQPPETSRGRRFCHLLPLTATPCQSGLAPRVGSRTLAFSRGEMGDGVGRRRRIRRSWNFAGHRMGSHSGESGSADAIVGRVRRLCRSPSMGIHLCGW